VAQKEIYHGEAIRKMIALFEPRNSAAYNWLIEKDHRELVEAVEYLKNGSEKSFRWLVDHNFLIIAAFVNAVRGDKKAFQWLMQSKQVFWAATANAVNKDKEAMLWLERNKFIVYAELATAIREFDKTDTSDFSGYYRPPTD
jgi:hypothetical protein